jgi:chemotaxis protein methyltransferase CheR
MDSITQTYVTPVMSDVEFNNLKMLIHSNFGINLTSTKKIMLSTRLSRRLKELNLSAFNDYYNLLQTSSGQVVEYNYLIDAVTTNKTDFFRENKHFELLQNDLLKKIIKEKSFSFEKKIYCWSAGCSTGEEPYTLAMVLADFFSRYQTGDFEIFATDISNGVLRVAKNAVYNEIDINPIPEALRKKYLLRGKNDRKGEFRIIPSLREKVCFRQLNLMDSDFLINRKLDIVFCRNVIIYFDRQTQIDFFNKIYDVLSPGGLLFIGSSETLFNINDRFTPIGPTVYKKEE